MAPTRITTAFSVVDRFEANDFPALNELCCRTIVQVAATDAEIDAGILDVIGGQGGLAALSFVLTAGRPSLADGVRFADLLDDCMTPVVAFGLPPADLASLWAMGQVDRIPLLTIMSIGKAAGFDMTGVANAVTAAKCAC
jgi:protein tyrosine phosphatase (PTP) superfamily phosphohydrolase (DUF442 family)